jgi:hypothetical protein
MPLSPPDARRQLHTRRITCQGFKRDDGLWDIEGRITDCKTYDFPNRDRGGVVAAGEAVHHMEVRLTIDDGRVIRAAEVTIDFAPFSVCAAIAPDFSGLVGMSLGAGFNKQLTAKFGGTRGCTHVVELMGPIATTAFQTMAGHSEQAAGRQEQEEQRPPVIDRCHALAADGEVVARRWPQFAAVIHD